MPHLTVNVTDSHNVTTSTTLDDFATPDTELVTPSVGGYSVFNILTPSVGDLESRTPTTSILKSPDPLLKNGVTFQNVAKLKSNC